MIEKILKLVAKYDCQEMIYWNEDLEFSVNCNDLFYWGCSDEEEIVEDDLEEFERALEDADYLGPYLFAARKRGMRVQGAFYNVLIPDNLKYLFDECGPEREINMGNPEKEK